MTTTRYRTRPVLVEAYQYDPDNAETHAKILELLDRPYMRGHWRLPSQNHDRSLAVHAPGKVYPYYLRPGDWLVVRGYNLTVVTNGEFERDYEEAS